MNRILIVDDEHHIVNWLSCMLESLSDLDLEISRAYSGEEALALLERYRMDILLLDIQMPGLDGLEVAERVNQSWPSSYIIFLTGYDHFDSIYRATRLSHVSYLIKTESDESIIREIRTCLDRLEEDRRMGRLSRQASSHHLVMTHLLQADFLDDLLSGRSVAQIRHTIRKYNISLTVDLDRALYPGLVRLPAGQIGADTPDYASVRQELPSLMSSALNPMDGFAVLPAGVSSFLWLIQPDSVSGNSLFSPQDYLKNVFEEFVSLCETQLSCSCLTLLYTEPTEWKDVYEIFLSLQEYQLQKLPSLTESSLCITVRRDQLKPASFSGTSFSTSSARQLPSQLRLQLSQQNREKYFHILDRICVQLCQDESMHNLCSIELYMKTASLLLECINQFHLQESIALQINLYSLYYTINFFSWREASDYLKKLSGILFRELTLQEKNRHIELVEYIRQYINGNLSGDLSLNALSDHFNYNSSYLSHLFKQITGTGLSEYITTARIEKAAGLLKHSSESISSVAEKTGFDTTQYFSYVFKKRKGLTPSDYRLKKKRDDATPL